MHKIEKQVDDATLGAKASLQARVEQVRWASLIAVWTSLSAMVMVASTYALWFPGIIATEFPQIPLSSGLVNVPYWVDSLASTLLMSSWLAVAVSSWRLSSNQRGHKGFWQMLLFSGYVLIVVCGITLVSLNQHRLQPWHYEFTLVALVLGLAPLGKQHRYLRWIVISIYLYSALSKLDFEFVHTVGSQITWQALELVGLAKTVDPESVPRIAFLLPCIELVVALGLMVRPLARLFGVAAITLHVALLAVLGPLGLEHSSGVLLWNIHFIGMVLLLFVMPPKSVFATSKELGENQVDEAMTTRPEPWLARMRHRCLQPILALVLVLPLGERLGLWDHWLSWALYAPHSSRAQLLVARTAVTRLPAEVQRMLSEPEEGVLWQRVPMEVWSLEALGVPIYPQARFQLGVARDIAARFNAEFEVRVNVLGVASRWDGARDVATWEGSRELTRAARKHWLGTEPRSHGTTRPNGKE